MLLIPLISRAPKKTHHPPLVLFGFTLQRPIESTPCGEEDDGTNRCVELIPNAALSGVRRWMNSVTRAVVTMRVRKIAPSARCQRKPLRLKTRSQMLSRNAGRTVATCACTARGAWMRGSSVMEGGAGGRRAGSVKTVRIVPR